MRRAGLLVVLLMQGVSSSLPHAGRVTAPLRPFPLGGFDSQARDGGCERLRQKIPLRLRGGLDVQAFELQLGQTIQALHVMHDPLETQERRRDALAVCEGIKRDDKLCALAARHLVGIDCDDVIRHFGFQLYEHLVARRWVELPAEMRNAFKIEILAIMSSGTRPLAQEQRFVMEKIAQVVVRIARSEWPDAWPSLFGDLRALATAGDVQRYLVLLVWKGLADDTTSPDIASTARTRMLKGLQSEQVLHSARRWRAGVAAKRSRVRLLFAKRWLLLARRGGRDTS
jgi:hypothetical protein